MSRALPQHANLEHLRKQAKDLLRELQQQNAGAKLADAQQTIAREYGFASWPKLKHHVESLPAHENPFVGMWTANVSKSKRHPANQFQRATLRFHVVGDAVTITNVVVGESGREERGTHTIQADGQAHPPNGGGYALVAHWRGSHILEVVGTKDGKVIGRGIYEVSADGKTLTVSTKNASENSDGWATDVDHVIEFDRT